jgi:hypothetical protein
MLHPSDPRPLFALSASKSTRSLGSGTVISSANLRAARASTTTVQFDLMNIDAGFLSAKVERDFGGHEL